MAPDPQPDAPAPAEPAQDQQQDANTEPPASPPLPQRHTAVTPGPRAARLQELYARSLKKTLGKIGWENVAGCYPTVAKRAEGVLRQVQAQMVDKLGEKCELNARLQTTQSQNALLADQVRRQREEIKALLDALETVVADVQGANNALRPVVDDVAAETRQGIDAVEGTGDGQQGTTTTTTTT
ncbi:hypothetical protein F66182_640 [Fusarium sp. NRRL 66182]|nr:hypothetical protein F66182_640 [Fusarium sp. NRRL 66182]